MSHPAPRPAFAVRFVPGLALSLALAAILVAACGSTTPIPSTPSPSPSAEAPTTTPSPAASDDGSAPAAGQTDTAWGRIWDALPLAFPVYPGATPADDTQAEPVSAAFALEGQEARAVIGWMQTELERAAYSTEGLNGPLEDGSFVLESVGDGDCRIQTSVAPLGGLTTIGIRYGAACPSP
jgi:hypothetical protein